MQHGDYSNYIFHSFDNWGLIAIRHSLFFLDFCHGEMAKLARKNSAFSPLIFAILPSIFALMAKLFSPFLPYNGENFCHNGENFRQFCHYFSPFSHFCHSSHQFSRYFCHYGENGENGEKIYRDFSPFLLLFSQKSMAKLK